MPATHDFKETCMKNIPIGPKLIGGFLSLLLIVCTGLGYIAYSQSAKAVLEQVEANIVLMAEDGAKIIRSELNYYLVALEGIASQGVFQSSDWDSKRQVMLEATKRLGFMGMGIVGPDGEARYPDGKTASLGDREYVKKAMAGETAFSDVIISRVTNSPVMMLATPVKNSAGKITGVLIARQNAELLSELADGIHYGESGYSYIINGKGTLIAHPDREFVLKQRNFIQEAGEDSQYARLAEMMQRMITGEHGFDAYPFMGSDRFFGFAPIEGTDWSIAVGAMKDEIFAPVHRLQWIITMASGVFLVLGMGIALFISRSITSPVRRLSRYAEAVARGDLEARSTIDQKDEIGKLNQNIRIMVGKLIEKMAEAQEKTELAREETHKAQLATEEAQEAQEEAERAKTEGMMQAAANLEGVVERMTSASEELAAQVEEASRGAEEQKSRTTQTATAMEEMNATVLEVAHNASQAAEGSDKARVKANDGMGVVTEAVTAINQVQRQARELTGNLGNLGQKAEEIGRIMNVIEDIADQTNLLALNAAIEAARAGDAGRGFAVVADEVRKLAEKTMITTKEVGEAISAIQQGTRENIEGMDQAGQAVDEATRLVHTSGETLQEIVGLVESAADQVRSIATAAEEQSSASEEINTSVDDINRIASETSEVMVQSAQAISELARQAAELQELVQSLKQE
jgi:methyl-accepting chemotaxis protein